MHRASRSLLLLLVLASPIPLALGAQEIPGGSDPILPAEREDDKGIPEDSAYLIDTKLNDADVELIWDGYWRIRLAAGGAFGKKDSQNIFPALQRGVTFTQEPDLALSLWLNRRWFIETIFQGSLERNLYRGGYVGQEDEFVQEVIIGSSGISASSYAGVKVPSPHEGSPGISAKFLTPKTKHEILLRFDPTISRKKVFQGQYEVSVQDIGLMEFIEGKYFILPDKNISNTVVYLEDRYGSAAGRDGLGTQRRYRLARSAEYFVNEQSGLLELRDPHDGQVIVYYENQNGRAVGEEVVDDFVIKPDSSLRPQMKLILGASDYAEFAFDREDVYDPDKREFGITSRVDINGRGHLILYEPGRFTPFERQNVYRSSRPLPEESWRIVPQLRDRGTFYPTESVDFSFIPDVQEKTITVYASAVSGDPRHPANRYPFSISDPQVYGPGRETDSSKLSKTIVLAIRVKNPGYYLGTSVVPGSAVVYINGMRDETARISADGRLILSRFIHLNDWIEVIFRIEGSRFTSGDLFIYQGNHFQLTPKLTLELAESMRWNINRERAVSKYEESPGEITIAASLDWKTDNAGVHLKSDATLSTPDTTGNLRVLGMEDGRLSVLFFESTLFAAPESIPNITGTRKGADKYNYFSFDSFGRERLNDYLWNQAASTGKDGPALAASRRGDPVESRVMDLRFDFQSVENYWSAGDFLADVRNPIDLSSYTAIELPIMFRNDHGDGSGLGDNVPDIFLQIGEIGESEDHHRDGAINLADSGRMLEWNLSDYAETSEAIEEAWKSSGAWKALKITLTASQRAKLSSVRALRLVITNTASSISGNTAAAGDALELSGRAILGSPKFDGSSFRTEIRKASNELAARQHVAGTEIAHGALGEAFPEILSLFHQGGKENRVLKLSWGEDVPGGSHIEANDRWEAVSWFSGIPMEAYRTLVFFVYDEGRSGNITARITDEEGLGIKVSWISSKGGKWDRIRVDIAKGTASSALGNTIETVSVDKNAGELTRFVISGADAGGDSSGAENSGTILFDEVYFRDPAFSVAGGARVSAHWSYEKDIAMIGKFPILGDVALKGSVDVSGGTTISGVGKDNVAYSGSMGIGTDILGMELNTDWQGAWNLGKMNWSGSHTLIIPANYEVFWFRDAYSRGKSGETLTFSRLNDLNLKLDIGRLRIFSDAIYDSRSVVQSWGAETTWGKKGWNAELDVKYILNSKKFKAQSGDYFSSWIKDYALLWPAEGEVFNREIHHTSNVNAGIGPFSVEWSPELRMKAHRKPKWNQENRWAGTLSFPIRFPTWSVTPSYRRSFRQLIDTNESGNGSYENLWHNFVNNAKTQFPLFTYVPFRELFGEKDGRVFERVTKKTLEADYEAEYTLDMKRIVGSSFIDLLAPNYSGLSIRRKYLRKGDTIGWENEWRKTLGYEAVNLFGRFGTYPIISAYNSDQFSTLVQIVSKTMNNLPVSASYELLWQSNLLFRGERNKRFILDNRIHWYWDNRGRDTRQEAKLEYRWRTAAKDVLHLPLFKRTIPTQHYVESREILLLKGRYPRKDKLDTSTFSMAVTIRHESAWVFPEIGEFKTWLTLGLGAFGEVFSNGWELGIEAELHF